MLQRKSTVKMVHVTDPVELAKSSARDERAERNWLWFQEHLREFGDSHRGKHVCIAGQSLFAADTPEQVFALAQAAFPQDDGFLVHYIPRENRARIYASAW